MSVVDDPKTFGRTRLSFASVADIDEFVATLDRFERGEITPDLPSAAPRSALRAFSD